MKKVIILIILILLIIVSLIYILNYKNDDKDIIISKENNEIRVKHELTDNENIIIVYNQNRNNDFFDMSQFIIQDKNAEDNDFTGEIVMSTATDFISPYGLLVKDNPVNNKGFTVGGAHGTNGSDGFPTGRFEKIEYIKLDNELIKDNGIYKGEKLDLKVNHFVYASNVISDKQKRDSLLEERFYSITNMNHEVEVKLTALEDLILTRYAGLQMTQPDFYDYFYFPGLKNIYDIKGEAPGLYTLNEKSYDTLDRAVLYNDKSMLIMMTDRNYGIGSGDLAANSTWENPQSPLTYTGGEFGKIYSHNLGRNNADVRLNKGETISYRGGYYFREFNFNNSEENSYEINNDIYRDEINIKNK